MNIWMSCNLRIVTNEVSGRQLMSHRLAVCGTIAFEKFKGTDEQVCFRVVWMLSDNWLLGVDA